MIRENGHRASGTLGNEERQASGGGMASSTPYIHRHVICRHCEEEDKRI